MSLLDAAVKAASHVQRTRAAAQNEILEWRKTRPALLQQGSNAASHIATKSGANDFVIRAVKVSRPAHQADAIQFDAGESYPVTGPDGQVKFAVSSASLVLELDAAGAIIVTFYPAAKGPAPSNGKQVLTCDPGRLGMTELICTFAIAAAHDDWTNPVIFRDGLPGFDWNSAVTPIT